MVLCHRNNFSRVSNEFPLEGLRNTMIILEAVSQLEVSSQRERHSDFHIYPSMEVEIHPSVLLSSYLLVPDSCFSRSGAWSVWLWWGFFYITPTKHAQSCPLKSKVIWPSCLCKLPLNHIFKMLGPLRIVGLLHRCRQSLSILPLHSTRAVPQGEPLNPHPQQLGVLSSWVSRIQL